MDSYLPDGQGYCPFNPRKPVYGNLFVGREKEVKAIRSLVRRARQGETCITYISGQQGIGKTSLALRCKKLLEFDDEIQGFRIFLGRSTGPRDLGAFLEFTTKHLLEEKIGQPELRNRIQRVFERYVEEVSVAGIKFRNSDQIRDLPGNTDEFMSFLHRFKLEVIQGRGRRDRPIAIFFDDLDGVVTEPFFLDFLRGTIEINLGRERGLALVIVLCGSTQMFAKMRDGSDNGARVTTLIKRLEIEPLRSEEVRAFFEEAFSSTGSYVAPEAMEKLVSFSHGLPQLMHLIGENVFALAGNGASIECSMACRGIVQAADELGKYQHSKVRAVFSYPGLQGILRALAEKPVGWTFTRKELVERVGKENQHQADRFIQYLLKLGVVVNGERRGQYRFLDRLVGLYIQKEARLRPSCDCGFGRP